VSHEIDPQIPEKGEPNPFSLENANFAFENAQYVLCSRCGASVPRELARSKVNITTTSGPVEQEFVGRYLLCPSCFEQPTARQKFSWRKELRALLIGVPLTVPVLLYLMWRAGWWFR
jgi:hypothetical protein